jgi:hypothetical protein
MAMAELRCELHGKGKEKPSDELIWQSIARKSIAKAK